MPIWFNQCSEEIIELKSKKKLKININEPEKLKVVDDEFFSLTGDGYDWK